LSIPPYNNSVFINCPFGIPWYDEMLEAVVFTVVNCGFYPRSAKEVEDAANIRLFKIYDLIEQCRFGIHDISYTELDAPENCPRFNMPFELGVFLGARHFGKDKSKPALIFDREKWRYRIFLSDISGQDLSNHQCDIKKVVEQVRDFLNSWSDERLPSHNSIQDRLDLFQADLPLLCDAMGFNRNSLKYPDYLSFVSEWLQDRES